MKIRGLQFPALIVKRPNKRKDWFSLILVDRDGDKFKVSFSMLISHYGKNAFVIKNDPAVISKSSMGSLNYISPNELPDKYKRYLLVGIFDEKTEGKLREI